MGDETRHGGDTIADRAKQCVDELEVVMPAVAAIAIKYKDILPLGEAWPKEQADRLDALFKKIEEDTGVSGF